MSLGHGQLQNSAGSFLLTEFPDLMSPRDTSEGTGLSLAQKLAKLHSTPAPVPDGYDRPMFGFPVTTYCDGTPQDNHYCDSWSKFYADHRLRAIGKLIGKKYGANSQVVSLIEKTALQVVPMLLGEGHLGGHKGISSVLVHGDLWSGNRRRGRIGVSDGVEDVIFDPSSCFAHSEYELGIMKMFGGFGEDFYKEYHKLLPKTEPQSEYEDRVELYEL